MLILTQLQCAVHHDICHTLQIVEYNQTKLHCHVTNQISLFIIQSRYSHYIINPQDLSCSQYQHEACYPKIELINHIQYNNGNEMKSEKLTSVSVQYCTIQGPSDSWYKKKNLSL